MTAPRFLLGTIIAACIAATITRGTHDGVTLIGLAALTVWLWTYGVFTRDFWSRPAGGDAAADLSRDVSGSVVGSEVAASGVPARTVSETTSTVSPGVGGLVEAVEAEPPASTATAELAREDASMCVVDRAHAEVTHKRALAAERGGLMGVTSREKLDRTVLTVDEEHEVHGILLRTPIRAPRVDLDRDLEEVLAGRDTPDLDEADAPLLRAALSAVSYLRVRDTHEGAWMNFRYSLGDSGVLIDVDSRDDVERGADAAVYEGEALSLVVDLRDPLDDMLFRLARGLRRRDFVRLAAELIRILGNTVRFRSLSKRAFSNAVRGMGLLDAALRVVVRANRDADASNPHAERESSADPRREVTDPHDAHGIDTPKGRVA